MKSCTKCGAVKPLSEFVAKSRNKDGRASHCKACGSLAGKTYYATHKDELKKTRAVWSRNNADRRLVSRLRYEQSNREAIAARKADYYKKNAARIREVQAIYQQQNAEKIVARVQAYREANREQIRYTKSAWSSRNRHRVLIYAARRRAAKLRATPPWAQEEKVAEFYFAADFLGMVTGEWYHVDHIVPIQSKVVCGLHCETNLQVIPGLENQTKGNRYWPDMP